MAIAFWLITSGMYTQLKAGHCSSNADQSSIHVLRHFGAVLMFKQYPACVCRLWWETIAFWLLTNGMHTQLQADLCSSNTDQCSVHVLKRF